MVIGAIHVSRFRHPSYTYDLMTSCGAQRAKQLGTAELLLPVPASRLPTFLSAHALNMCSTLHSVLYRPSTSRQHSCLGAMRW